MYQVLARKYRPRNFNELVGQNHVSRALTSALDRGRLHHAYLFTGTRGVGKTTIARILAKCLNCETGVTSTPCEVCATCKAVNEGRFIDLIEIDAASRTKVEDTRELLDNVPYAPTQGRFKVYLIDEVHMLSTHSFNALLKTLEEPPEHVKFLFATTDPQKLPITVISRCLQFTLRPLAVDEITHHLTDILNKEEISSEQDAIWQIAESAQGSLRDALSLTDQAIAYGQGAIHHQDVKEMLGLIDRTIIYDLILAIHQNQNARVSQLLLQFRQQALDVSLVLDQFISTLHELAMLQYLPDLSLKYSAEINQKIMQLSKIVSAQDLQLYYQIASKGRAELQLAVTQEQGFEMTVLRLLAFRPMQINEIVVSQAQQPQNNQNIDQVVISQQPHQASVQTGLVQQAQIQQEPAHQQQAQQVPVEKNSEQQNVTLNVSSQPETDAPLAETQQAQVEVNSQRIVSDLAPAFDQVEDQQTQQQSVDHEPSSDDYLDDFAEEVQQSAVVESTAHNNQGIEAQQPTVQDKIDVENAEPSLTLFGAELSQPKNTTPQSSPNQDVFFLAPENQDQNVEIDLVEPIHSQTDTPAQVSNIIPEIEHGSCSEEQTPQQILALKLQVLEGEWTVDKWEYWFRNSSLSPAVQELAQHGLMTGDVNGQSIFQISQKYEKLLNQAQHDLEAKLKQQWPSTLFTVQYGEVESTTPYMMQNERKLRAYDRASEMLQKEPLVKSLIEALDGKLENIQLKA
ncbi:MULTISPECIES: DNA polymerase III subunit gamma/tau [Acinetobacter]|uniref:DNA polymerase III subunit gamma/tau n=1 Tax=Acinetobacter TaxID=469 RepID=UPI0004D47991|nr:MULTISPECIES: DNA polymerase III subunit gamma/tau [unclassified Acinetobacter]KEC83879.1 DNA polymerase III [Acinetobacter sp. ETR1]WEE41266.1 DNA polymerase III subunit gamma/tau [Acinetobacter sp. TAC-1]